MHAGSEQKSRRPGSAASVPHYAERVHLIFRTAFTCSLFRTPLPAVGFSPAPAALVLSSTILKRRTSPQVHTAGDQNHLLAHPNRRYSDLWADSVQLAVQPERGMPLSAPCACSLNSASPRNSEDWMLFRVWSPGKASQEAVLQWPAYLGRGISIKVPTTTRLGLAWPAPARYPGKFPPSHNMSCRARAPSLDFSDLMRYLFVSIRMR